ncbi:MAG: RHS repeat-associated core domain-containing protein, partial [Myxococcales bacterium]|nr:RHS repeat-associated core domain-containing protein [Myxococcales bacterium]
YFVYDASGRRVRKVYVHSGLREERLYLGGYELYRKYTVSTGNLEVERETVHISDDARRICMVETLTVDGGSAVGSPTPRYRFQLDNHLGTACVEVTNAGAVISLEEYHPYGTSSYRSFQSSEVSAKRYRYTGKERDEETSLYYHGARYYAPWLGRWMSADPAGTVDGTNLFAYVRGSPVVMSDPSGTERVYLNEDTIVGYGPGAGLTSSPYAPGSGDLSQGPIGSPAKGLGITNLPGGGGGEGGAGAGTGQQGSGPGTDPIPTPAPVPELYYPTDEELALQPEKKFGMRVNPELSAAPVPRQVTAEEDLADTSAKIGLLPGPHAEVVAAGIDLGLAFGNPTFGNVAQATFSVAAIFIVGVGSGWLRESGLLDDALDVTSGIAHHELPDVPTPRTAEEIAAHADYARLSGEGFGGLSRASEFGIKSYDELTKDLAKSGLEAHHLIEKRFAATLGVDPEKMASIAVTEAEHTAFTKRWREAIPYGEGTATATKEQILRAAREIYAGHPAIRKALGL